MYKYCVAFVYVNCLGETRVTYKAWENDRGYFGYETGNFNDGNIVWYNTKEEAKSVRDLCGRENACVLCRYFEE